MRTQTFPRWGIGMSLLLLGLAGCFPLVQYGQPTPTAVPPLGLIGASLVGAAPAAQPVAQAGSQGQPPEEVRAASLPTPIPTGVPAARAPSCPNIPAGWTPYRVLRGDTLYRIAVAHGTTINILARANCLSDPQLIHTGQTLYLPTGEDAAALPVQSPSVLAAIGGGSDGVQGAAGAVLPLVILHFAADRTTAAPGQTVRLTWTTQGPVASVQIGWLHQGQVILERAGLPASGALEVTIPADGRQTAPFILQVSDGSAAASAFATVQVNCAASWFFRPAPADLCPYPDVGVQVAAQRFENGLVLALPSLGRFYVLFDDGTWQAYADTFRPGTSYRDAGLLPPADRLQPEGATGHLWRSDAALAARLGWATLAPAAYSGTLQRAASPDRETVYLTSPDGGLLALAEGLPWQSFAPARTGQGE